MKYATFDGSTWHVETVDSDGNVGNDACLALDSLGNPHIAYPDETNHTLKYAVWNGSGFEPRLMLPLSFSYDHRVIDGAQAARFTTFLGKVLADVDLLLKAASQ